MTTREDSATAAGHGSRRLLYFSRTPVEISGFTRTGGVVMFVVIDTSVLVDIFLTTRSRHARADHLQRLMKRSGITARLPMHGMFEVAAAIRQEKLASAGRTLAFNPSLSPAEPLHIDTVAIDQSFFEKYFSVDLPYLRAGDLIYVALAKRDQLHLITEDDQQYARGKEAGVDAFRIEEYITRLEGGG